MKVYKVKVNGKVYEVELEAVTESNTKIEPAKSEPAPLQQGSKEVTAPIAGKVVRTLVKVGDKVTKGQAVCVIEAMKLENEVPSPFDGKVTNVLVNKGQSVNLKDVLVIME